MCFYSAYEGAVKLILTYCFKIVQYYDISYLQLFSFICKWKKQTHLNKFTINTDAASIVSTCFLRFALVITTLW